ncbi:hypothetical protein SAMN05421766_102279 [Zobellia uliginosa]|uniref:Uncharacterized protein n=1 Tax=Zobellia uliginosa TaxID=143224 RepID=A0ABY1KLX0_9FLAO|nr:hypothetical protein SAMN05421766_102279 [Zobellia uliginosa]
MVKTPEIRFSGVFPLGSCLDKDFGYNYPMAHVECEKQKERYSYH